MKEVDFDLDRYRELLLDDARYKAFCDLGIKKGLEEVIEDVREKYGSSSKVDNAVVVFLKAWESLVAQNNSLIDRYCESPIEKLFFRNLVFWSIRFTRPIIIAPPFQDTGEEICTTEKRLKGLQKDLAEFSKEAGIVKGFEILQEQREYALPLYFMLTHICDICEVFHFFIQAKLPTVGSGIRVDAIGWYPKSRQKLVIECDGFQFHSSTKAFTADRQRDRNLLRAGYQTVRFSGSEIYANAVFPGLEVIDLLKKPRGFASASRKGGK